MATTRKPNAPKTTPAERIDAAFNTAADARAALKVADGQTLITDAKWQRFANQVAAQVTLGNAVVILMTECGEVSPSAKRVFELASLAPDMDGANVISRGSKRAKESLGSDATATRAWQMATRHTAERFAEYRAASPDHKPNAAHYLAWLGGTISGELPADTDEYSVTKSADTGAIILKPKTIARGGSGSKVKSILSPVMVAADVAALDAIAKEQDLTLDLSAFDDETLTKMAILFACRVRVRELTATPVEPGKPDAAAMLAAALNAK